MITVSQTVATDFRDLVLIKNAAYGDKVKHTVRKLSEIKKVLENSDEVLTFRDECGILGIVGYGGDLYNPELFAYIDEGLKLRFKPSYQKFMKHMVVYMLDYSNAISFRTLVKPSSQTANKFIQALGFKLERTFVGPDNNLYNEYVLWRKG